MRPPEKCGHILVARGFILTENCRQLFLIALFGS